MDEEERVKPTRVIEALSPQRVAAEFGESAVSDGWFMITADDPYQAVSELCDTLTGLDLHPAVVDVQVGVPAWVAARGDANPVVVRGAWTWSAASFADLDLYRDALRLRSPFLFLVLTPDAMDLLARHAPNVAAYFHAESGDWSDGTMTEAQVEEHLRAYRSRYGKSDEEVVRLAEAGTLPTEPEYYAWLVLLGRGDLVPRAVGPVERGGA
jgi:hypothetical protein